METRLDLAIKNIYSYSREYSKEIISKGYVLVNGKVIKKPSFKVFDNDKIELLEEATPKYVSRGGLKLEKAIDYFNIDLKDKVCMDIGSSTGGFSDCMLQNGAKQIYAIDVGTSQLDEKILKNEKVLSFENTDIREFDTSQKFDFISTDVSFISLTKILEKIEYFLQDNGQAVVLVKPQFEVGKENVDKNGIVKNKNLHIKTLQNISNFCKDIGLFVKDATFSPITGTKGNIEYLLNIDKKETLKNIPFKAIVFEAFEKLK